MDTDGWWKVRIARGTTSLTRRRWQRFRKVPGTHRSLLFTILTCDGSCQGTHGKAVKWWSFRRMILFCEADAIGREARFRSRSRSRAASLAVLHSFASNAPLLCSTGDRYRRCRANRGFHHGPDLARWHGQYLWDMSLRLFVKVGG